MNARLAEQFAEVIEETYGVLGRGCSDEAGALSFACVREERELRDGQDGPSYVSDTAVHLPFFVGHDPQPCYLFGQPCRLGFAVSMRNADQQE